MKEFIDKLIEKIVNTPTKCLDTYSISSPDIITGVKNGIEYGCASRQHEIIDIINELAEEHAKTPTPNHSIPIDTQKYIEELECRAKTAVELTDREREVLNTNLSAEIMKMQFHYGNNVPERLQVLYNLRDKLCHKEDKK